jgi:hypothetical protein
MTWPFTLLALHRQEMPTDAENRDPVTSQWTYISEVTRQPSSRL